MQLQVRRVSTVISHTETRWENAIEKSKREGKTRLKNRKCDSNAGSGSGSSSKLRTPKMRRNNNKTIHNVQQRTAGYGAKRLVNLI